MLLSSSVYFFFLIGIFFLYWPLSKWRAAGLAVLLLANYFFYAKWDIFYLALIPLASSIDYTIGLWLGRTKAPGARKALVTLSILVNLGILAVFKYAGFFLESWGQLTGQAVGKWEWVFPLGISFYCFQSLTYTIDIYRKDAKPTESYLAHLTAVSFFPTTLAGPITRVADLIKQLEKPNRTLDAADPRVTRLSLRAATGQQGYADQGPCEQLAKGSRRGSHGPFRLSLPFRETPRPDSTRGTTERRMR
jgi:D-alanyl-lipoteichoic acid acyltransferase DltB (MBOAT superfamily)